MVVGCEVQLTPSADPRRALAACRAAVAPATDDQMDEWLTELMLVSARRAADTDTVDLTMEAYIKRLRPYPGDVVREVLQSWSGKWFPTWGELKEVLDDRAGPRFAIMAKLAPLVPAEPQRTSAPAAGARSRAQVEEELFRRKKFGLQWREAVPAGVSERDFIDAEIKRLTEELQSLEG
jgi:hypothetical protein